jgi:leucyl aminopeptidase (aminopeptidase T)
MASGGNDPALVARRILSDGVGLKRGESVIIETWNHTLPYAAACVVEARRIGARPMLLLEDETAYWRSLDVAPSIARWAKVGGPEWAALAHTDGYVFFPGPSDMPRLRSMPTAQYGQLTGYNSEWYRRARKARVRGVRCALGYASDSQATLYGVSVSDWRAQLARGIASPDPRALRARGRKVAAKLAKGKLLRITASNGTDLTVRLRGRRPWIDDGAVDAEDLRRGHNMAVLPAGAVAVAVHERGAMGAAIANRPTYLGLARLDGGQWEIADSRLTGALYTEGQSAFDDRFQKAAKGKEVLSYLSIGLNPALGPGVPMVEDQEAGAVTLGIGGNSSYGGSNRVPFFSWIVVGEATVAVDGAPLCDRGQVL